MIGNELIPVDRQKLKPSNLKPSSSELGTFSINLVKLKFYLLN